MHMCASKRSPSFPPYFPFTYDNRVSQRFDHSLLLLAVPFTHSSAVFFDFLSIAMIGLPFSYFRTSES